MKIRINIPCGHISMKILQNLRLVTFENIVQIKPMLCTSFEGSFCYNWCIKKGAFLLLTCSWRMSLNVFVRMKCGDNVTNSVLIQISKKNKNKSHKIFLFYSNISILKTLFYCNSKVNIYNKENWFCIEIISILWQPNNLTN